MQLIDCYVSAWKNTFNFKGRARRSAYWYFFLANLIVSIFLSILNMRMLATVIYPLAVFFPHISLSIRRLHDISKSGWFYLFCFIPLVGWIFMLIWMCMDSTPGPNQYGPNPKGFNPYPGQQNWQQPTNSSFREKDPYQGPEL